MVISDDNYYNMIDRKVEELKSHGIEDEDIAAILHADLNYNFQQINSEIEQREIDKDMISKIVDSKIIKHVETFLNDASKRFDRIYTNSVFYALCMHLSAMLERKRRVTEAVQRTDCNDDKGT